MGRIHTSTKTEDVEVLHGLCHAFGSLTTVEEADVGLRLWLAATDADWDIHVHLLDNDGALFVPVDRAMDGSVQERLHSAVASRKSSLLLEVDSNHAVGTFPMVSRGDVFGVVELVGPPETLEARWRTIESIVSQVAILLRTLRVRSALEHELSVLRDVHDVEVRMASVAHELKGPIVGVRHAIDVALRIGLPDGTPRTLLQKSKRELQHLDEVIEGLLNQRSRTSEPAVFDLFALVFDSIAAIKDEAEGHSLHLSGEAVEVRAHPARLRIAITNVLRNAVRHSPAGSAVKVSVEDRDSAASVKIEDSGPGVATEELSAIFEPYRRGANALLPGAGLGLFISRTILESHGGSIKAEHRSGGGARFILEIPHEPVSIGLHDVC